jgi:ABC-type multidrug transport system fused ATPase/permease subunit
VTGDAAVAGSAEAGAVGVRLTDVAVTHAGRDVAALRGVSLALVPGELLALSGPSGGGKSTLLAVLLGLVRPDDGAVRVAGVDLADVDPASWHARVAWAPQRPRLVSGTVEENVRLGAPDATAAQVADAVRLAALDDVVAALPQRLATPVGEGGRGLSAGQAQRVAVARALLRCLTGQAGVLLLDEPTAHLDPTTEARVVAGVRALVRAHRLVAVVVVHREAVARAADRTVHLAGGRLVDAGDVAAVAVSTNSALASETDPQQATDLPSAVDAAAGTVHTAQANPLPADGRSPSAADASSLGPQATDDTQAKATPDTGDVEGVDR